LQSEIRRSGTNARFVNTFPTLRDGGALPLGAQGRTDLGKRDAEFLSELDRDTRRSVAVISALVAAGSVALTSPFRS
jgi:hypothetical protein